MKNMLNKVRVHGKVNLPHTIHIRCKLALFMFIRDVHDGEKRDVNYTNQYLLTKRAGI